MENQSGVICFSCKSIVPGDAYFCPNCGRQLRQKSPVSTILKQAVVYSVSLFLPPFGLWYAWKYLQAGDSKSRKIGIAAVVLTAISVAATIWLTGMLVDSVIQSVNKINSQIDSLSPS